MRRFVHLGLVSLGLFSLSTLNASAQQSTVVRVGLTPVETAGGVYYAEELGLFRKAGVTVKLENLRGGAAIISAVTGGDLDVGFASPLSVITAYQRGIPIKAFLIASLYSTKSSQSLLVIAPDRTAPKAADLNGKVFCGVSVGGMDQLAVNVWMDKMGGESRTIKYVELPPAAEPVALAEGRVDVCVLAQPVLSAEMSKNTVKAISKVYGVAFGDNFAMALFFGSNSWLSANPGVAKKFAEAVSEGQRWGSTHPKEAAVMLAKYTKVLLPQAQMVAPRSADPALVQPIIDAAAKYKFIPRPMNATELLWQAP